ncbi:MAG: hypothetical protein LUQ28_14540, partial [Methylococcaceae bacterium]|nr:hypothetical protein [Methylococcaceae bacterium]
MRNRQTQPKGNVCVDVQRRSLAGKLTPPCKSSGVCLTLQIIATFHQEAFSMPLRAMVFKLPFQGS